MSGSGGPYAAPLVKPWWQSRTLAGIAVLLISMALKRANVDIVDAEITDIVTLAMDTIGASLAIYGRISARKQLKLTRPGGPWNPKAEVRRAKRVGMIGILFWGALAMHAEARECWRVERYADAPAGHCPLVPRATEVRNSWLPNITPGWPLRSGRWLIEWKGTF